MSRALFALLLLMLSASVFAITGESFYQMTLNGKAFSSKTSSADSCAMYVGGLNAAYPGVGYSMKGVRTLSAGYGADKFECSYVITGRSTINTVNGGFFQCAETKPYFDAATGTCSAKGPEPVCPLNKELSAVQRYGTSMAGAVGRFPDHIDGCEIQVMEVLHCDQTVATGVYSCTYKVRTTGNAYTGSNAATSAQDEATASPVAPATPSQMPSTSTDGKTVNCPTGSVQGGTDSGGIPICIGKGTTPSTGTSSSSTQKPTTTTTASDGTTTKTEVTETKNADGSVTTNTTITTTKPDGTVSVDAKGTTSAAPSGAAGKPTDKAPDFCASHPDLAVCRNSTVSGSCGDLACTGDAIQCATLRAASKIQCTQQADEDTLKAMSAKGLGDSILGGSDPMKGQIDTAIKGTEVDLSKANLDAAGFVGGGSCIPDKSFTVRGKSISVSFSAVCENIQPLRYAIMACAYILVYLMAAKSVVNS